MAGVSPHPAQLNGLRDGSRGPGSNRLPILPVPPRENEPVATSPRKKASDWAEAAKVLKPVDAERARKKAQWEKKRRNVRELSAETAKFVEELKSDSRERNYEILEHIGRGKFSSVYKARMGGKLFAVKKMRIFEMMSVRAQEKCLQEVRLLESLRHKNIIRYVDSFIDDNKRELVIVLSYADGGDLKTLLRRVAQLNKTFNEQQVWRFCEQISDALAFMHKQRIMHRDLKPANIMLTRDQRVHVADLGLSRFFTSQTLEAFSKVGTPLYMPPEVLQGDGYSFSADVWSLGCVLYELCMLRSPFKPEAKISLFQLFNVIKTGTYAPIPTSSGFSATLRGLIQRMLSLDPRKRPSFAQVHALAVKMTAAVSSTRAVPPVPEVGARPLKLPDYSHVVRASAGPQRMEEVDSVSLEDSARVCHSEAEEDIPMPRPAAEWRTHAQAVISKGSLRALPGVQAGWRANVSAIQHRWTALHQVKRLGSSPRALHTDLSETLGLIERAERTLHRHPQLRAQCDEFKHLHGTAEALHDAWVEASNGVRTHEETLSALQNKLEKVDTQLHQQGDKTRLRQHATVTALNRLRTAATQLRGRLALLHLLTTAPPVT